MCRYMWQLEDDVRYLLLSFHPVHLFVCLRQGLSLNPKVTHLARFVGQQAPGTCLSLPTLDKVTDTLTFSMGAGHLNSVPYACPTSSNPFL